MKEPTTVMSLPLEAGYQARTLIKLEKSCLNYEVATVDTRRIKYAEGTSPEVIQHLVGKYPFETTVYRLVNINEPVTSYEELFGDSINVDHVYRRDFAVGDLYLSRSKTAESAALEHESVVNDLLQGQLNLMTQKERMALYGIGATID